MKKKHNKNIPFLFKSHGSFDLDFCRQIVEVLYIFYETKPRKNLHKD